MTIRELENICKRHFYLHQLFCQKRCFGPQATLNVVMEPGKTKRCRTIKDLVDAEMYVPSHMQIYEAEFASIPPIAGPGGVLEDDAELVIRQPGDGGPESPFVISRREADAARARCLVKRKIAIQIAQLERSLSAVESPFDYAI